MNEKIAYLQMIQSVIARMARNSFLIKGWSITVVAALGALAAAGTSELFVYLACFPAAMFWALDAYFLRQEKLYRKLWDRAREPGAEVDFSMETKPFNGKVDSIAKLARSPTLGLFHGTIAGMIVVVIVVILADRHLC